MQHSNGRNARPIGVGRVPAVERRVDSARGRHAIDADETRQTIELLGQHLHQADAPTPRRRCCARRRRRADLDALGCAGCGVDVAQDDAIFLHDSQPVGGIDRVLADVERFDDEDVGTREIFGKLRMTRLPLAPRPDRGFRPCCGCARTSRRSLARSLAKKSANAMRPASSASGSRMTRSRPER